MYKITDCMGNRVHIASLSETFFTLLLALFLAGCSSLPTPSMPWSQPAPESDPSAEAIFKQAMDQLNNKRYAQAIIQFEIIRTEFPFSTQVVEADLKIAEAQYLSKQYPEAALSFKEFLALRPNNENIPFVIYRLGLVHFEQFTSIDRDQKEIGIAQGYFETVIKDYANSPYAADSIEKLAKCREYLAEREFYVASFYLKEKKYSAAKEAALLFTIFFFLVSVFLLLRLFRGGKWVDRVSNSTEESPLGSPLLRNDLFFRHPDSFFLLIIFWGRDEYRPPIAHQQHR